MTHIIKSLAALALGAMLLTSCGKDNKDNEALIGKWYNTAQSYEITIDGRQNIPEGYICMEFTDDKVWVSDSRTDCYATWNVAIRVGYLWWKSSPATNLCWRRSPVEPTGTSATS